MINKSKQLYANHLRLILTLAVDVLTVAELINKRVGFLRPWLLPERRVFTSYAISDRRTAAWWPFNAPSHERTPHVIFCALLGMTVVILTSLISASASHVEMLLMIPAYGAFLTVILQLRQHQLDISTG